MYTFVFLLVSFGVVFPKLCLTSIQLKKVKKKKQTQNVKKTTQTQKADASPPWQHGGRHPFQHTGKGRPRLQRRRCVPWSAARDGNTAMLGEDQEGK